jgi:hypothetical protein
MQMSQRASVQRKTERRLLIFPPDSLSVIFQQLVVGMEILQGHFIWSKNN